MREGWNLIDLASPVEFTHFRYYKHGAVGGSCDFSEIQFFGYEVIPVTTTTHTCDAVVTTNGNTQTLTGSVSYLTTNTPIILDISPKYGSYQGNTQITITGTGLGAGNVKVDGIDCVASGTTNAG